MSYIAKKETTEKKCYELWRLLDDIDTLDDMAKEDDKAFREACYKIQQRRWEIINEDTIAKLYDKYNDINNS